MRVLIVGCGYVGLPVGIELQRAGHEVFGLRRSPAAEAELRALGIKPVLGDITKPDGLPSLPGPFDWVVNCTSASGGGPEAYRKVYVEGMRHLLSRLERQPPKCFVYTSSTSVYGQNDGSWVTEESPTEPPSATAKVLLEAEHLILRAHGSLGFPAIVLRLAGIYGPGRGFWFKQFLGGTATMEGEGKRFLNLIQRDDAAGAITAAIVRGKPGEVYNVVDDEPVAQREMFRWLAETLHKPMPPSVPPDDSRRKRGATNKRISNRKLRESLKYSLRFPTFREGFGTVLEASP